MLKSVSKKISNIENQASILDITSIEKVSSWMASTIISKLHDDYDDLNINHHVRNTLKRCFNKVITLASKTEEKVLFYQDIIPGFTVMLIKKDGWSFNNLVLPENKSAIDSAQVKIVEEIISEFVSRTGSRVLLINAEDARVVLFPTSDLKKNLIEMITS